MYALAGSEKKTFLGVFIKTSIILFTYHKINGYILHVGFNLYHILRLQISTKILLFTKTKRSLFRFSFYAA